MSCPLCDELLVAPASAERAARAWAHYRATGHVTAAVVQQMLAGTAARHRPLDATLSPAAFWLLVTVAAGVSVPLLGLMEAPAPVFLVPAAVLWTAGRAGAKSTKEKTLGYELFDRCREVALWLLPGLAAWSVVWVQLVPDTFDGSLRMAGIESRLRALDATFEWIERARDTELIIAAVIVLLALVHTAQPLRRRLVGGAKLLFPWLRRVGYLWIGLTAFTVLGPERAAQAPVEAARVELARRCKELADGGRKLAHAAIRAALHDAVDAARAQTALRQPLAALDADASDVDACGKLKGRFDANGPRRCPTPHDWARWREEAVKALVDFQPRRDVEAALANRALDSLSYDDVQRRLDALSGAESHAPARDAQPSEEVEYVIEQAADALYEHGPKEAIEGLLPLLDGVSEMPLIAPILDALLHDSVKDVVARAVERFARGKHDEAPPTSEALRAEIANALPPIGPDAVRAAASVAKRDARAPAAREYLATLKRQAEIAADRDAAILAKRQWARGELQIVAQELHDAKLFIRVAGKAPLLDHALEYVPRERLLIDDAFAPPEAAVVIDARGLDRIQLADLIRRLAPDSYRMHAEMRRLAQDADLGFARLRDIVAQPRKNIDVINLDITRRDFPIGDTVPGLAPNPTSDIWSPHSAILERPPIERPTYEPRPIEVTPPFRFELIP